MRIFEQNFVRTTQRKFLAWITAKTALTHKQQLMCDRVTLFGPYVSLSRTVGHWYL